MGTRYDEVDVPMLHIGGWFDFFLGGTLRMFQGVQAHARTEAARGYPSVTCPRMGRRPDGRGGRSTNSRGANPAAVGTRSTVVGRTTGPGLRTAPVRGAHVPPGTSPPLSGAIASYGTSASSMSG